MAATENAAVDRGKMPCTVKLVNLKRRSMASTGHVALDHILGGGIPFGTIFLIEEGDSTSSFHSEGLLKHFISEGIVNDDTVIVVGHEYLTKKLISTLPSPLERNENSAYKAECEKLKIAWRYGEAAKTDDFTAMHSLGNIYDTSKFLSQDVVDNAKIVSWDTSTDVVNYSHLLYYLTQNVTSAEHTVGDDGKMFRIVIPFLGTANWTGNVAVFLMYLRHLLRSTDAVAMLTIPRKLLKSTQIVERCEHSCDTVISVKSVDRQVKPAHAGYDGLIHVKRLPSVHRVTSHVPSTLHWAFTNSKTRFTIEKMHLTMDVDQSSASSGTFEAMNSCNVATSKELF